MPTDPAGVLKFWFGEPPALALDRYALWFRKHPDTDRLLRDRYGTDVAAALDGQRDDWAGSTRGRLALILLLDQFTRNIYRDTARAFAGDAQALQFALQGIDLGTDLQLEPLQRVFFYLPLEHAEDRDLQARCVELFTSLRDAADPGELADYTNFLDYAHRHRAVIDRFGRFPHRNTLLGRRSTADEIEFLRQPGSSF